jgi:putative ubiquitin-RnfH superfamily antitoxin RatB of RatAB toxin-antitoxin module
MMEGAGNTLLPIQGTIADGLLVNLGANNDITISSGTTTVTQATGTNLHTVIDSGTITETNSAAIKTAVELIDNAISGSEMQVDVVAALPTGTNTLGSIKITDGADVVDAYALSSTPIGTDIGLVTNSIIYGKSTAGGGAFVEVKVNPSGTLTVDPGVNIDIRDLVFATDKVDASGTVLGAGTNNIGDVDVLSLPAITIASSQTLATVTTVSAVTAITNALPAGTNNIGDIDVLSLPSIPAGTNNIGDVDIASIAAGTNYIGKTRLTDGTTDAEVIPLTNYNAQAVAIVDASGNQITSFGSASTPLFTGKTATFRTLGRAGTTGQKIAAIHNATGSSIKVKVRRIRVDMWSTVVRAVTVAPPLIRLWKFTAVPTNGTALTKNKAGGSTTSNASCTLWGDASADGTGSATTLTVTLPAGTILDQQAAPRIITAVGEVSVAESVFDYPEYIELAALEGVCVFLDYTLATQNPVTDMWTVSIQWDETS